MAERDQVSSGPAGHGRASVADGAGGAIDGSGGADANAHRLVTGSHRGIVSSSNGSFYLLCNRGTRAAGRNPPGMQRRGGGEVGNHTISDFGSPNIKGQGCELRHHCPPAKWVSAL